MQSHHRFGTLYSASDLVAFLDCRHRTTLDLRKLVGWDVNRAAPDAATKLVQDYGDRHERAYLAELSASSVCVVEIDKSLPLERQVEATRDAMNAGADVIFQAALLAPPLLGYADFLFKVPGTSNLGAYHYEVADTKLAKSNRAKFLVQLCFYADLLEGAQGVLPETLHVVLGKLTLEEKIKRGMAADAQNTERLRTRDFIHYFRNVKAAFLEFLGQPEVTVPVPTAACQQCGWREHCAGVWLEADHLSQVANIRRDQIGKLEAQGVHTMSSLARLTADVKGIGMQVLARLTMQAELQCQPRGADGRLRFERLPARPDGKPAGFELLPEPDAGDLYFDMEGFPHELGGLEYLFGVGFHPDGDLRRVEFKPFWAHDRASEKLAFEAFMDFVEQRLARYPKAHIYHYAPYERTAIKHLAGIHDTRTQLRDRLLREARLVDLYRVVASGLILAVPSYSIKKVESYYRGQRETEVANAGESIVKYAAFRVADDPKVKARLLDDIERYNRDDVESTEQLHRWLETLRPADARRFPIPVAAEADEPPAAANERDQREAAAKQALTQWASSQAEADRPDAQALSDLLGHLLGFYWRCKLPLLWKIYERQDKEEHELLDDPECLAMLEFTGERQPEARSTRYTYRVPDQETKLYSGASVTCLTDERPASNLVYDEDAGVASFTRAANKQAPPDVMTLVATDTIKVDPKLDAIFSFAYRLTSRDLNRRNAVLSVLMRQLPCIAGRPDGAPVASDASLPEVIDAVCGMRHSHLVIQGPPGTGKTTIAAQVIAQLLVDGKRIGITSNSHAAINHLLKAAVARAMAMGAPVNACVVKKDELLPAGIRVIDPKDLDSARHNPVGGTAWLFCRPEQRRKWDYLFVDEASQVSLADVVAAGQCAENIVLLGDQMQLPQPTQGVHPGESGMSALDYLMRNHATVPPDQGIFLAQTYRMHPDVCRPISECVYEGRLASAPQCAVQRLVLNAHADPALKPTGVIYVPVHHEHRGQHAPEEVERIRDLYASLLKQQWIDREGMVRPMTCDDILVTAPYNAQVRALKKALGRDARVGTVDKFQGQEAAVAICSMTSSDSDSAPKGIGFVLDINRLNVGLSRSLCASIVVASIAISHSTTKNISDLKGINFYSLIAMKIENYQEVN